MSMVGDETEVGYRHGVLPAVSRLMCYVLWKGYYVSLPR